MRQPTLQHFPLQPGIDAIKGSLSYSDFDTFYRELSDCLPQNSPGTREKYASLIVHWFMPERSLGCVPARVWKSYEDDQLLLETLRVPALEAEPMVASFILGQVLPLAPGEEFDLSMARDFITVTLGVFNDKSYTRLIRVALQLGFLERRGKVWAIAHVPPPADALLILLHERMAPTPRIVRVSDILERPWWRYLGLRHPDEVRAILHRAYDAGLLARYSTVDQLEQVTTRYPLDDYLGRALRLGP
jgi:hypothetical protein